MPFDLGDDPTGIVPACCPVAEAGIVPANLDGRAADSEPLPPKTVRPVRFVWTYGDLYGLMFSLRAGDVTAKQAFYGGLWPVFVLP